MGGHVRACEVGNQVNSRGSMKTERQVTEWDCPAQGRVHVASPEDK